MAILSATRIGSAKERSLSTVEIGVGASEQEALNNVCERLKVSCELKKSKTGERIVCCSEKDTVPIEEQSSPTIRATIFRLSVSNNLTQHLSIHFRNADPNEINAEWMARVGTVSEVLPKISVPEDNRVLASYPAAMGASLFGGHDQYTPVPGIWLSKNGEKWMCEGMLDIPSDEAGTAIAAAFEQLQNLDMVVNTLDISSPKNNFPLVLQ